MPYSAKERFTNPNWVFDVASAHPHLFEALCANAPGLVSVLHDMRSAIPLPPHAAPGIFDNLYRITNHNRSFCLALDGKDGAPLFDRQTLVIKGAEPLLADFPSFAKWLGTAPYRRTWESSAAGDSLAPRIGDHFPIAENKVPGVVTLAEAQHEAALATEVQLAHLRHYGELAPLPLPLLIHAFPPDDVERCLSTLTASLSPPAAAKCAKLLSNGVGLYIYHLPTSSYRLGDMSTQSGYDLFFKHTHQSFNPQRTTESWIRLFVRLLYLGYLPYTPWNRGLGACMDTGNATIQGGCCDIDSLVPFTQVRDKAFFTTSIIESLDFLVALVGWVLTSHAPRRLANAIARQYVMQRIQTLLASEVRPGLILDDRVRAALSAGSFADAQAVLAGCDDHPARYAMASGATA